MVGITTNRKSFCTIRNYCDFEGELNFLETATSIGLCVRNTTNDAFAISLHMWKLPWLQTNSFQVCIRTSSLSNFMHWFVHMECTNQKTFGNCHCFWCVLCILLPLLHHRSVTKEGTTAQWNLVHAVWNDWNCFLKSLKSLKSHHNLNQIHC